MTKKLETATDAILSVVVPAIGKLRTAGNVACPSDDLARNAISGCVNSRTGQWKRSKPKNNDEAALLWDLVKFHNGTGSLWGFPWFADPLVRDQLDTLAIVLLGNKSNAADAWAKAIYG